MDDKAVEVTQKQIAEAIGLSRERVSTLLEKVKPLAAGSGARAARYRLTDVSKVLKAQARLHARMTEKWNERDRKLSAAARQAKEPTP